MTPDPPLRILMVCLGNICRSPVAMVAVREAARAAGMEVEVDSAGTAPWNVGNPPDRRMVAAASSVGLRVSGRARQVTAADFARFDLVVAMDDANRRELFRLAPDEDARARVRLFRDYAGETGQDVPDPYFGGPDGFAEVVAIVKSAAAGLVAAIGAGTA